MAKPRNSVASVEYAQARPMTGSRGGEQSPRFEVVDGAPLDSQNQAPFTAILPNEEAAQNERQELYRAAAQAGRKLKTRLFPRSDGSIALQWSVKRDLEVDETPEAEGDETEGDE
jgi:hypothetical protein